MKPKKVVVTIVSALVLFGMASAVFAADTYVVKKGDRYTVYNTKHKCQMICKAPKPALEILEDGLAYLVDLPLALLSPITCPIFAPVRDYIDPVEKRSYRRR